VNRTNCCFYYYLGLHNAADPNHHAADLSGSEDDDALNCLASLLEAESRTSPSGPSRCTEIPDIVQVSEFAARAHCII